MATLQICYRDSSGKVVCTDSTVQRAMVSTSDKEDGKPNKKDVQHAIDTITQLLLAETPEYFALVYAPDGVQMPPTAP